jgi:hypothetical protein
MPSIGSVLPVWGARSGYDGARCHIGEVNVKNPRGYLVAALCSGFAFVLQGIGTVRYVSRLPDDGVGIGLYLITTVLFAVTAVGFYSKWIADRREMDDSPSR